MDDRLSAIATFEEHLAWLHGFEDDEPDKQREIAAFQECLDVVQGQTDEEYQASLERFDDDFEQQHSDWSVGMYWDRPNDKFHKHRQNPETGLCSGRCKHCGTGHKGEVIAVA